MVTPSHLRPGNWIHRLGSSRYGIVNGALLALLEEDEKERERFEYIELTGELLEAAGFVECHDRYGGWIQSPGKYRLRVMKDDSGYLWQLSNKQVRLQHLHELQNLAFLLCEGQELPLPESALIINQTLEK